MTTRAALYARVSTARQEEEQTVASQIAALEQAARALGVPVPAERRFVDDGFSGSRLDRPGLDALRDAVADGLVDLILIHCPDRLARNYVHQQVVIEELEKRGATIHFVERPISDRPEDRLLVQMQGVIAEYERAKILERTRRGKIHKLRMGQMLPYTSAPYGYAIVRSNAVPQGIVVIDEVEAQHVRSVYRWVIEDGLTARAAAKRLNEQGVRPRRAKRWFQSAVYQILTNPAYAGMATYNRRESTEPKRPRQPGAYRKHAKSSVRFRPREQWLWVPIPALVDEKTQDDVRQQLTRNKVFSGRNIQHDYLLRRLVVCGLCNWKMECQHMFRKDKRHEYFYYGCRHGDWLETSSDERCRARRVRANHLDEVVWDAVVSWIQSPSMLREELETFRASRAGAAHATGERARVEQTGLRLDLQLDRLLDAYQQGALTVDELKGRRERLEAARQATQARADALAAQEQDGARLDQLAADLEAFAATLRTGLADLDFTGRQRLVRLLIERVVVTGDHVAIEHAIPLSGRFYRLRPQHVEAPRASHEDAPGEPALTRKIVGRAVVTRARRCNRLAWRVHFAVDIAVLSCDMGNRLITHSTNK